MDGNVNIGLSRSVVAGSWQWLPAFSGAQGKRCLKMPGQRDCGGYKRPELSGKLEDHRNPGDGRSVRCVENRKQHKVSVGRFEL